MSTTTTRRVFVDFRFHPLGDKDAWDVQTVALDVEAEPTDADVLAALVAYTHWPAERLIVEAVREIPNGETR